VHGENGHAIEALYWQALMLLAAAIVFVPLLKRLGLSSILGYLAAGVLIGPLLGRITDPESLLQFSEFGVTLLLFVIGLELKPSTLWRMRGEIFGLGFAQVVACGLALALASLLLEPGWQAALVIGFGLALSSTALVMQLLAERRELATPHGRTGFAVLLFQDLAIVPLLLLVTLLSSGGEALSLGEAAGNVGLALAAILALVLAGRYLLNPLFSVLARAATPEIMTAAALALVIAAAGLMSLAGMSYGMGAFLAGVMLAESTYRHELEADIEPFRGLFLGLFFMAVGMSLDLEAVAANLVVILVATPLAMLVKGVVIYALARAFRHGHSEAAALGLYLSQFGEFGFVLFASAAAAGLFSEATASTLVAIVTLSMVLAPFALRLLPLIAPTRARVIEEDFEDAEANVIIIGFGRFGQIVAQAFLAQHIRVTIIDADAERVEEAGRFGSRIYFGNGRRRDVLAAAGAAKAALVCVCVDDREDANAIVALLRANFPKAQVFARAYDRIHAIELVRLGVDHQVRETFESAIAFGAAALEALGLSSRAVAETIADIRERDAKRLALQVENGLMAGRDKFRTPSVKPEPLTAPVRRSVRIDRTPSEPETIGT